ncbi:MFS transporter [Corallococcus sicarius]|uniref:MFS transporter n=1 Tax=Corallococcus sicarius TaxID=2316726 RepID=A0A3A8NVS0_9BACT|nr:MFS transporter [Corallococcus sicarius]RKH47589.1 MFS transporter [Corallococcus sicarius]
MSLTSTVTAPPAATSALRIPGYRTFLITFLLAMMADNIEHVISYWVAFQKFNSPALGGFAVVSHWLPFLMFSVPVGALNDRFDSRRLIQAGMVLFITVSVGWGYFFVTDTLQMWHAMVLLTLHGCAGVLWGTSSQMLLYDIVGTASLASAVRLNATARYLGFLVGPAVGSIIMRMFGPTWGIFINTAFYLPLLLWLVGAPHGRHFRGGTTGPKPAVRGFADIVQTVRDVRGLPVVAPMVMLAGGASFFIGNSYHAQMPGFAHELGHGDPGLAYTLLLAADAAGALLAGVLLETRGTWLPMTAASALKIAFLWGCSLFMFSFMSWYPAAIGVLFVAGFLELSFSSMTQALVQLNAPDTIRGRVLGLFSMSASGLRAFSGVTVGLLGSVTNIHLSLGLSAVAFVVVAGLLLRRQPRPAA